MASVRLIVDTSDLKGLGDEAFMLPPDASNPLLQWNAGYSLAGMTERRPAVSESGSYRGNAWTELAPQYVRKDGTVVPVWGGVDRVRGTGQVKPKQRPSGAPYRPGSQQMQDTGRMFQDFFLSDPELGRNNTVLEKTSSLVYTPVQEERRPFTWGEQIESEEIERLEAEVLAYWDRVL